MASGLSIVIDTRNAELNIKNLNQALERLETQGNSVANMMRNLGGANPFAGLTTSITSLKDSFNEFAGSTNTAKTAIKNLADGFTSAKTAIDNATTASNAFNDSVKKVYTSADILTNKIGALNGGFTVLSQKADTASSALSRFAQNATTTSSSMGGLISQSHTLAQNMANMGATSNTGANNTGTALARVNGALSNTQAQMNGFNNTARNTQNTFNQFNANIHNTQNNFTQLNNNVNLTRNSLTALSSVVTNNTTVINNYSRSAVSAAQSTAIFQRSAHGLEATLMRLQTLMTGGLFGMAALSIAKTADAMQGLENQVRLVTQGEEQREEVQRRLLVIANKNYSDIEAATGSYQRNAFALAQLGKSQMDVLNFTDALSLAMRTGGRSMVEQKSAVYQLSQAMGAGKLMGDEFRALSENAPIILKYIAKEMGVAQGALKELGSEGKITSEIIYNAMMKARPEMEKMAQSLPITMSQAWQQVNNSYKTFVDNFMNGTGGISQGIASMLQGIGKNFDTLANTAMVGAGLAFVQFASKVDIAAKATAIFNAVVSANPFVLAATAAIAAGSAIYGFGNTVNYVSGALGQFVSNVTSIFGGVNTATQTSAANTEQTYSQMFANMSTQTDSFTANATATMNTAFGGLSTTMSAFAQDAQNANNAASFSYQSLGNIITAGVVVALGKYIATALAANGLTLANAAAMASSTVSTLGATAAQMRYNAMMSMTLVTVRGVVAVQGAWNLAQRAGMAITTASTGLMAVLNTRITASTVATGALRAAQAAGAVTMGAFGAVTNVATVAAGGLTGIVRVLGNVIKKHPLMVLASVLFGVVASTEGLEGAMKSLGDAIGIIGGILGDFVNFGVKQFGNLLTGAIDFTVGLFKGSKDSTFKSKDAFKDFFGNTEKGFVGMLQQVASVMDGVVKAIIAATHYSFSSVYNAYLKSQNLVTRFKNFVTGSSDAETIVQDPTWQNSWAYAEQKWGDKARIGVDGYIAQQKAEQNAANYAASKGLGNNPNLYNPIDPNAKPPSSSDSDTKNKKKKAHDLLKGEIADAIQWAAADLKIRPNDLAAVISFETSGTFSPAAKNPKSSATGLIQFMEDKYKSYGYTRNEFAALGVNEQMKYVVQYLKGRGIKQGSGLGDVYDAVAGYGYRRGSKAYELNRKWDANRDGYVAKGEAVTAKAFQPHIKNYFPNGINLQDVGKVETDLAKNQAALDKAREDYIASIATGEAKINTQLNKAIADLPSKGFSGQALEDEKKRLTEEAELDRLLSSETNRQKLDELMAVHKTKKDQILDESYLQGLTIAADESKSREQRKAELEALDVGTKEKIRLNDIANKYELGKIWAFRKTSSELIADEWNEKMDALREYTGEYKEEWRKAYEEQRKIALENDKLVNQQKLLDINVENLTDIDLINKRAELEQKILDNTPNISPDMYKAQSADILRKQNNSIYDTRKSANDGYMSTYFDLYGQKDKYDAYKGADDKRIAQNDAVQKALDAGIIQHEEYYQTLKDIDAQYVASKQAILVGGYQSIFGSMTSLMSAFGGEQSRAYRIMANIEKGYALYSAFLSEKVALGKAWASAPFPQNLVAVAKVALESSSIIGAITAFAPKGFSTGGYTGNMGVNDVAGVVHGKEYVLNAAATKRIGVDNLNAMNKGASIGNNNVSVNVVVNADGSSDVQANAQMGKQMGDAIKAAVLQTIVQEKRQGGLLSR